MPDINPHPDITKELLIEATRQAISQVRNPRYFSSERGYQGQFYSQLQSILEAQNIITADLILETEYQKRAATHSMTQRPDMILHIPREITQAAANENNYCVWALKRNSTQEDAFDDFNKLDSMFSDLCYPWGIFINIASQNHFLELYRGDFPERIAGISVQLQDDELLVNVAVIQNNELKITPYRM